MPYFVKSRGPVVIHRPFETEKEANEKAAELRLNPMYTEQQIYVEFGPAEPERRRTQRKPFRKKMRPRGRSRGRGGGRSSGRSSAGGGSSLRPKRRRQRRSGRRRG
jgi:uncharacterized membrane protein YgcG